MKEKTDSNLIYFTHTFRDFKNEFVTAEELDVLTRVNQKIASRESLDETMNYLFDETLDTFKGDRIGLAFVVEEGERIQAHWAKATYKQLLLKQGYTEDLSGSSLEDVIKKGYIRIINDFEDYISRNPKSTSTRILLDEGVRSSITVPLKVEDKVVAVLFRSSREKHAFDMKDAWKHLFLQERLGQAVEKTYIHEKLQDAYNAYLEMLGFVSHELKSPVASMVTDGRLLVQGYLGELDEKQKDKIGRMIAKGEYLLSLVKEYLDLSRVEGGALLPTFQDDVDFINDIVEPVIDIEKSHIEEKNIKLIRNFSQDKILIQCDMDLMKTVMINFISNAVKYGIENGEVRISVRKNEKELIVSIWNEGPGFPSSAKRNLFKKFSRINTPELMKRKGTGVGLYSSWKIIKLHHGRVHANSEEGSWAEFVFEIPQPILQD